MVHRTAQLEYQIKKWRFHKNFNENAVGFLRERIAHRARLGLESDVFLSTRMLPRLEVRRRIRRQFVPSIESFTPSQSLFLSTACPYLINQRLSRSQLTLMIGPLPATPENLDLSISTPAPLPLQFNFWPSNLPWLQSQATISTSKPIFTSIFLITH
jgi:hypothetical protein